MSTEWFYTTNKQQMGPVTWSELRELADRRILKPHDMVWTEGMEDWVKAINQSGLFADEEADNSPKSKSVQQSAYTETKPPPGRRSRPSDRDVEEEEDDEDEKEVKRKARKKQQERAQMAVGVKVGLILGGVVLFLMLLGCAGGLLFYWGVAGGGGAAKTQNYTILHLRPGVSNTRMFHLQQGKNVTITVTSSINHPDADVDVMVVRGPGNRDIIASDLKKEAGCRVEFRVPANDNYQIVVINSGRLVVPNCRVEIAER